MLSTHEELRKKFEELEKKYDTRLNKLDHRMQSVFEAFEEIKRLLNPPQDKRKRVGFV
jgi:predicted  nucleic acid-binding Zn-ribbon protein